VLDKYTGGRSLRAHWGFDNGAFEERLRELGFVVPGAARSNYPHTWMSLPSMLNWAFLDELLEGVSDHPVSALNAAIADNRAARFLQQRGYEFVFVPSTFSSTSSNAHADRQIPVADGRDGGRRGANIGAAWLASSAVNALPSLFDGGRAAGARFPYPIETAEDHERRFELLPRLAAEPGARFVFAHVLLPHEPYIFEADCTHREPYWPATDYVADQQPIRAAYLAQLQCLNRRLEQLVTELIAASAVPPIIILQSDHGHGMMALNPLRGDQLPLAQLKPAQVRERTDIFAAYYLPHGGDAVIYDSITPINVLPAIFNHYFDAGIEAKEDAIFWARLHPPFEITRIRFD
jgi:hypothetical protein